MLQAWSKDINPVVLPLPSGAAFGETWYLPVTIVASVMVVVYLDWLLQLSIGDKLVRKRWGNPQPRTEKQQKTIGQRKVSGENSAADVRRGNARVQGSVRKGWESKIPGVASLEQRRLENQRSEERLHEAKYKEFRERAEQEKEKQEEQSQIAEKGVRRQRTQEQERAVREIWAEQESQRRVQEMIDEEKKIWDRLIREEEQLEREERWEKERENREQEAREKRRHERAKYSKTAKQACGGSSTNQQGEQGRVLLEKYCNTWSNLARHEQNWPWPNPEFTEAGLRNRTFTKLNPGHLAACSEHTIIGLNTQIFFLKGDKLAFKLLVVGTEVKFDICSMGNEVEKVEALKGYLKRKELPRWHPDRMNLRTGVEDGRPDGGIGSMDVVAAVRTGIDELVERCQEALEAAEKGGCGGGERGRA